MGLPINIRDLLDGSTVEWERLECKAGWNPEAVLHTMCAFANDIHNWGGGYVVIGIDEQGGRPVFPPKGLPGGGIDRMQRELLNLCNRLSPPYFPVVEPTVVDGVHILVIWAPGGENRPYKAPISLKKGSRDAYYVRVGASTVIARGVLEQELLQLAAKVPFDDRLNHHAEVDDLRRGLIQAHLQEIRSGLAPDATSMDFVQLAKQLRIVGGPDENPRPINVGLLFFSERPDKFFDTTWIDVVYMPKGPSGSEIREVRFIGPLDQQLRSALEHIRTHFIEERTIKRPGRPEADRFFTYPYEAVEESLANAVYHRGYDEREPVEVRITPTEMTVTSYPGADPSVRVEALRTGRVVARRYRNRRVGEFLKELRLTEGRGTGIPTILRAMRDNGSPEPSFESDEIRSFFTTRLPIHPLAAEEAPSESDKAGRQVRDRVPEGILILVSEPHPQSILKLARQPCTRAELQAETGIRNAPYLLRRYIKPLLEAGVLAYTIPESPRAPNQKYRTTALGMRLLREMNRG